MRVEELGLEDWGELLPARGFDVFHTQEALDVIDRHSPGDLRLFGGFKGERAVGLFPVHVGSKAGGRLLTSPPLRFGIYRLGPILMPASPKQRKQESTNKEFVRGVLDSVDADRAFTVFRTVCSPRYGDTRPFTWSGFDVTPSYTYQLDLADATPDQLLQSFSRGLRYDIRSRDDVDVSIRRAGMDAAERTYRSIAVRYSEQNRRVPLQWGFVRDLLDALGEDRSRVYVAESADGKFLSGMIILYSNDTAYFWNGGVKTTQASVSPNSLLHWRIIEDILTDPALEAIDQYDLYTANDERLVAYKSGFGGTLTVYYTIESKNTLMTVAKRAYRTLSSGALPLRKES